MGFEDKYDAMCDYNAEQQGEGRAEVLAELVKFFKETDRRIWYSKEIVEELESWD